MNCENMYNIPSSNNSLRNNYHHKYKNNNIDEHNKTGFQSKFTIRSDDDANVEHIDDMICLNPDTSNGNYQDATIERLSYHDLCSSPDQLDDIMNSNERLDMVDCCSDNENLEQLGRKVDELINENRLAIQSTATTTAITTVSAITASVGSMKPATTILEPLVKASTTLTTTTSILASTATEAKTILANSSTIGSRHFENNKNNGEQNNPQHCVSNFENNEQNMNDVKLARVARCTILHGNSLATASQQHRSEIFSVVKNINIECKKQADGGKGKEDNLCEEDSWSDEEGEDTDYNYSLRRRR